MSDPPKSEARSYDDVYKGFDSPLAQQVRQEAYGKDIGQHSWVTAEELQEDIARLKLTRASRFLDLGCGPCGPLTYVVGLVGCHGSGTDASLQAIVAGRARAASLGLEKLIALQEADLNEAIPFASGSFNTVMSLDVILHLRDRAELFREVRRVLVPSGRFLFTDAGVITGSISDEEIRSRAVHGYTQFVPPGFNERMLELAGFRCLECDDRTDSLLKNAAGRLTARAAHRAELEQVESGASFEHQQRYLETVVSLSRRGAVSRMMYLADSAAA